MDQAITTAARKAREWMFEAAFPLWAEAGVDARGAFAEQIAADGSALQDESSRVRVQARQTYCFALAALLGWQPQRARELAAFGVDVLLTQCRRADGLYGRRMVPGGGLADDTADLYDCAFALLALSTAHRAGVEGARAAALEASAAIETHLKRPESEGGYRECLPAPAGRAQNPHMHLFESSLALYEATGEAEALARGRAIEALMERRFRQPGTGALREVFAPDWGPAEGDRLEAGHQYEWVWLLHERARLDARPVSPAAAGFYASAMRLTGPGGAVPLEHTLTGEVQDATERSWGLTEALKAHLAIREAGDDSAEARAIESHDRLWARHLEPAHPGGWLDRYDADGQPVKEPMTASTGYHVFLAFAELMRAAGID